MDCDTASSTAPHPFEARPVDVGVFLDLGDAAFGKVDLERADPRWVQEFLDECAYVTRAIVDGFAYVSAIYVTAHRGRGRRALVSVLPAGHEGPTVPIDPEHAAECRRLEDELRDLIDGHGEGWAVAMEAADARQGAQPLL
jgi:hypothetical protein